MPKLLFPVLYLGRGTPEASPKTISGRTSYSQARLAFHHLPQLVRGLCTTHRFGPPLPFQAGSPWPWQDRLASGLGHSPKRAICTRFRYASAPEGLRLGEYPNSPAPYAKGTPSAAERRPLTPCGQGGFRFYFTPLTGVLFTFPSRYWFTIGDAEYLALAGSTACFPRGSLTSRYSGLASRSNSLVFAYGALTLYGSPFQGLSANQTITPGQSPSRYPTTLNPFVSDKRV